MIASALWLLQQTPQLGEGQTLNMDEIWVAGGFMMWPLGICFGIGILIILWKLVDLQMKASKNKKVLRAADELISQGQLDEALAVCNDSTAPAAAVLKAGLARHQEGTERAMQAIEKHCISTDNTFRARTSPE